MFSLTFVLRYYEKEVSLQRFNALTNKIMDLIEQILALLKAQFSGVREDGLQQLAAALSLQVATKEEATELVGKLTAEKVGKFVNDWRKKADAEIAKATRTHENGLKEKYDFVEKGKPAPQPTPQPQPQPGGITLEQIKELIHSEMAGVQQSITNINAEKVAGSRETQFVAALDKAGIKGKTRDLLLDGFKGRTFKDDEEFNSYMTQQNTELAALAQEQADSGLLGGGKPIFGAVTEKGVSQGVADYIASKQSGNALTGKEI